MGLKFKPKVYKREGQFLKHVMVLTYLMFILCLTAYYKLMKFLWLLLMILFCSQKWLKQVKHIHELLSTIFALILQHYFLLLGFLFYNRMKCLFGTESNLLRLDRKPSSEKTAQYKLISFRITPWSKIVHIIQHQNICN